MKKKILIILIIIVIAGICGGAVWYGQKIVSDRKKANDVENSVLPPKYLSDMESCKNEGGKVDETTISRNTWTLVYQWMCTCQSNQQFFGQEKLECNKWLDAK